VRECDWQLTRAQTAARELREECGSDLRVHFYGNAPMFHVEYLFDDPAVRTFHKADGAKVSLRARAIKHQLIPVLDFLFSCYLYIWPSAVGQERTGRLCLVC
jgi:8-oxo-dGTP pyrophosphatase MutT (NUDIX family)